jgi:signal transduction histidine kinase
LLRDGMAIGVIGLARRQIEPYSERQVALVSTFADQAVIAIENARLFNEVQARTAELTRSVAELQALQEVLRVVNSSLDLETVLTTIIERAVPLAQADEGMIYEFDVTKQVFVPKATYGMTDDRVAAVRERRIHLGETYLGRSAAERVPIAVDDVQQDASTPEDRSLLQGIHAVLAVPLLREDVVIGGLVIRRRTEGAFVPDTIAQMQTFAAQSVLAIENARLFDEVQARTRDLAIALEQQTATAEALKVISRSAFDIQVVLDTLIESAVRLCNSDRGSIWLRDGEVFRIRAMHGMSPELWELFRNDARRATDAGSLLARLVATKAPDVGVDFTMTPFEVERLSRGSARSILTVPLLRDGEVEGMLSVGHSTSIPFTQRQVDLVQTFADQAVIAIENARLFDQVQARTQELTRSLDDLRRAQDRLVQTEKMASLGQLTAGIAHEIKNPLNFVNNFSDLSGELLDELVGALGPDVQTIDARLRAEIDDLAATLKGNLKKIAEHGKRADGIVKNMLLHSRSGPVESRPVDLNASCEEALNLAYHGARANMSGFNIALETDLDPVAGTVEMFPQDFTRGLLNLIGNGFYAVRKRAEQIANAGFEPTLRLSTKDLGDEVEIRVRDNGTGISEDVRDKIFDPFFTTKPPGEGTGLGLSLTFDIIVKQHGGQMRVESAVNDFTEFVVTLPRSALGSREHRRNQA